MVSIDADYGLWRATSGQTVKASGLWTIPDTNRSHFRRHAGQAALFAQAEL